jgi:hypothetical protein
MARPKGWTWTVIISGLLGVAGSSLFWLYSPYGRGRVLRPVTENVQTREPALAGKISVSTPAAMASQAVGSRFQMVADGKQIFLVDLKDGRVWRYFHNTKEGGFSKEDEGFLPMPLYFAGRKHYSAAEVESPPSVLGHPPQPAAGGKPPQ